MRKALLTILITAIICFAGSAAFFWWYTAPNLSLVPNLMNKAFHGKVTILNQFPATDNLEGYVVQSTENTSQAIVYADNRGRYLVVGQLIDADGQSISSQDYQHYISPESSSLAFNYISSVAYIQQGSNDAPHQAYVLFDPNCIFCHRLYEAMQPAIKSGELAVRWVPVAFLKPSSQGRVYALLAAKDPVAMLAQNEKNFNEETESGGIPPLSTASSQIVQQLQNNMAFLTSTQITATPAVLYKLADGTPKLDTGMVDPTKLKAMIDSFSKIF